MELMSSTKFKPVANNKKMVLCYYQMFQKTYSSDNMTALDAVTLNLCTHVLVQDFAELVSSDNVTFFVKQRKDLLPGAEDDVRQLVAMSDIKVILSLGGTDVESSRRFSMLANSDSRSAFIVNVVQFINQFRFSGLDVFWMYPGCWGNDCNLGNKDDKKNFATIIQELSDYLKPRRLLLSTIVPTSIVKLTGYDLFKLSESLDWICTMTYGMHGHWEVPKVVAHTSPMLEFKDALKYLAVMKVDPLKVIGAVGMFAQTYTLAEKNMTKLGAKFKGPGKAGDVSKTKGQLYFNELCYLIQREDWTTQQSKNEDKMATYSFKDDQWISFEEVYSIRAKMQYIYANGFGGVMAFSINMDDFSDRCGCGRFPLLRAINVELRGSRAELESCVKAQ